MTNEPTTLRKIARELPRRKVALVMLVVLVNLAVVTFLRGRAVAEERNRYRPVFTISEVFDWPTFVPPWEWTSHEWRETVWPWK